MGNTQTPLPDLVITSITVEPERPVPFEPIETTVIIGNTGDGDAEGFRVVFKAQTPQIKRINGLRAGETITMQFIWFGKAGEYVIEVEANPFGDIEESSLENNRSERTVRIEDPLPDLIIESLTIDPLHPKPNEQATVILVVANIGSVATTKRSVVSVMAGYKNVGAVIIEPIEASERLVLEVPWTPQVGEVVVRSIVDYQQRIEESNENNNDKAKIVNITTNSPSGAELAVSALSYEERRVIAQVGNDGSGPAVNITATLEIDGSVQNTIVIPRIMPSETLGIEFAYDPMPGERVLRVKIDADASVSEINEDDNADSIVLFFESTENECTQYVYLSVEEAGYTTFSRSLAFTKEQIRTIFIPRVKATMEAYFQGLNIVFTTSEQEKTHSALRFVNWSRDDRIIGQASPDPGNTRKDDFGILFIPALTSVYAFEEVRETIEGEVNFTARETAYILGLLLGLAMDNAQTNAQHSCHNIMCDQGTFDTAFEEGFLTEDNLVYLRSVLSFTCDR